MERISLTSAVLENFSRSAKGGKAQFSSSLTSHVQNKMGWVDIPECLTGASLDGELLTTSVTICPSQKDLSKHAFDIDANKISKFETVRLELEGKKGKGHRTELRFVLYFSDLKGCRKLEEYMVTIGDVKSTISVSYEKQPEQTVMEEVQATEEQRQATLEATD